MNYRQFSGGSKSQIVEMLKRRHVVGTSPLPPQYWLLQLLLLIPVAGLRCEAAWALDNLIPDFRQEAPDNGSPDQIKLVSMEDTSNEAMGRATVQEFVARAGFAYENHYVLSDDGYITQLVRIVNPLADPTKLKQPPVMLMHGGIISATIWVFGSNIQHHPEKYPRGPDDLAITSWNRSLAFTLSNNGYDVWLVGTRGSSRQNQAHLKYSVWNPQSLFENSDKVAKNNRQMVQQTARKAVKELLESHKYWDFSQDDLVTYELPRQIDRVLELTGSEKVNLICFSYSTMIATSLLAENVTYADKVHTYIAMAPILTREGSNIYLYLLTQHCIGVPYWHGEVVVNHYVTTHFLRDVDLEIGSERHLRYSFGKFLLDLIGGTSPRYKTLADSAVIGHLLQPTSFKEVQHYCQQVVAGRLQRYDEGWIKNLIKYGSFRPPARNITNIHVKNWLVITGAKDNLGTPESSRLLIKSTYPPPEAQVLVANASHLDLVAAWDNDVSVNRPILEFLDRHHLPSRPNPSSIYREAHNHYDNALRAHLLEESNPRVRRPES